MSANSRIEWTNATWNPVTGCTKVSPGCAHCYAEGMAKRLQTMGVEKYRNGFQVTLHPEALEEPLRWRKPRMVFVCSMGDLFHEDVPDEFIGAVFDVMASADQHIFQVLTKRAERMADLLTRPNWTPSPNVWVGVTAENEEYFDQRVPHLMRITQATVRFVSAEPLLGPIFLPLWVAPNTPTCACPRSLYLNDGWPSMDSSAKLGVDRCPECGNYYMATSGIDWLIVGGESGPGARPMKPEWARSLRDRARRLGIPFFFKQWGGVNKHRAGRVLDGREWNEMPVIENGVRLSSESHG